MGRHSRMNKTRYIVWKGDEVIAHGTAAEIAEQLKVKPSTVRFWSSPANKARDLGNRRVAERV